MPSVSIPSSGLVLNPKNEASKPGVGLPEAFCLTLADNVIEDMIKCVKAGQEMTLSFGRTPAFFYGTKAQHLLVSNEDPFTTELYRTELTKANESEDEMAPSHFITRTNKRHLVPTTRKITASAAKAAIAKEAVDPAIEALKAGMSEEMSKKSSSAAYVEKPAIKKRGAKATNTSRFLAQNKKTFASDTTRSMPTSHALTSVGSPSLGATSVPLSQRKAEKDKEVRNPIVHFLAADKAKDEEIWDFFTARTDHSRDDFKTALEKVADFDTTSKTWSLRPKNFKELDPWAFEYASDKDREKAVEHAIKAFDKMRMHPTEPEWQRLLPESERGQGKILSRLTAKIAEKSGKKSPGHDTETDEDKLLGDGLAAKSGEAMSRSASSGPAPKNKKISEKEAQAKRLLGKPGKIKAAGKASPAPPKTSPAKKPAAKKEDTSRIKSSQFVNESDGEDDAPLEPVRKAPVPAPAPAPAKAAAPKPAAPAAKPAVKRARAEDKTEVTATQPAAKKVKKDEGTPSMLKGNAAKPRISNSSKNSQSSRSTAPSSAKTKTSSPPKSSPLASSPPTNASDIDDEPYHTSSSSSPYTSNLSALKRKAVADTGPRVAKKPANGRQRDSTSSSTSPPSMNGTASSGRPVSTEVLDMADRFRTFYATYVELYRKLEDSPNPSEQEVKDLQEMHSKLREMKYKIFDAVRP